jgi:hypothetical protein
MRWLLAILALLLAVAGLIWILQGLDVSFAPRSFMTNDRTWTVIGAITLAAGIALGWFALRRA